MESVLLGAAIAAWLFMPGVLVPVNTGGPPPRPSTLYRY